MSPEKLAHMANQIATFFRLKPEAEAASAIAGHINDFWEPRMRRQLLDLVEAGGAGLEPRVMAAAPMIRRPEGAHA
jgi:formate dehydrogenase subunit delta